MADRTGQQFGNYRLVRLLGQGGYAEVYMGQHLRLNRQPAWTNLIAWWAAACASFIAMMALPFTRYCSAASQGGGKPGPYPATKRCHVPYRVRAGLAPALALT